MMAVFTIQAPDGRKIKIQAQDQDTAIRGAQEWAAANPAPTKLAGKVTPQGSSGEVSSNVQGLDAQGSYDFNLKKIRDTYYPKATEEQWRGIVDKLFKPYGAGDLFRGAQVMGLNDELTGAAQSIVSMFNGQDMGKSFDDFTNMERARQALGSSQAGPLGMVAEMGGALMSGRPDMAAARATGFVPAVLQGAREGAAQGAIYGGLSANGGVPERVRGALQGAAFGGVTGAAVPAVVGAAKRVISPARAPAAKVRAAGVLQQEGVELTAGQATGNKNLQFREAELGGNAAGDFMERQTEQFTSAALRRAGVQANRATPDVVDTAFSTIGQQFDDLAARNGLQTDARFVQDLQGAWRRFDNVTNANTRPPFVERMLQDIAARMRTGYAFLDGNWFKATRSELARVSRTTSNPELKEAIGDLMGAFDDAMERTLRQSNPADLGAWREARRLYRNMLVIEDAIGRAGEQAADGIISPQALRGAALRQNKRSFVRGRSEFTDLANAGVSAMTPLPNSGTAGRLNAKTFMPIGAATGATVGSVAGLPGAFVGGLAGAAAPWAVGRAMLSGPGRAYLQNQVAARPIGGLASLLGAAAARSEQPLLSQ